MTNTLRCTCAAHGVFKAIELAPGLPARQCAACEGTVLALDAYRVWRDRADGVPDSTLPQTVIHGLVAVDDSAGVRVCPQCSRLMQRLRVSTQQPDFRIDRCAPCQTVWLDRGEWAALAENGLARRLDEVLSDRWQRHLQQEDQRARHEAVLRARLGDDCMNELARIRAWLDVQPQRDELLALLRAGW
jgi:Zn-finger nucleic acid-binding protein